MFEISVFLLAGRLRTVRPCVVKKKIVFVEVVTLVRTLVPRSGAASALVTGKDGPLARRLGFAYRCVLAQPVEGA